MLYIKRPISLVKNWDDDNCPRGVNTETRKDGDRQERTA